jgi:hypothetical protein
VGVQGPLNSRAFKGETSGGGNLFEIGAFLTREPVVDGVKVIGGYAKHLATCKRNHRIKRIRARVVSWGGRRAGGRRPEGRDEPAS